MFNYTSINTAFVGCSFTYGYGLQNRDNSFPSLLRGTNLGEPGASNNQIFKNAVNALIEYERVIVQWTEPGRGHFTSAEVPIVMQTSKEQWRMDFVVPKKIWNIFVDVFKIVQNDFDDFTNIKEYVSTLDTLASYLNKKVYFLNGLMHVKKEYMIPPFTEEQQKYNDVLSFLDDTKNWINTNKSLRNMSIDRGSDNHHPGQESHRLYADMILQYMNKKESA